MTIGSVLAAKLLNDQGRRELLPDLVFSPLLLKASSVVVWFYQNGITGLLPGK